MEQSISDCSIDVGTEHPKYWWHPLVPIFPLVSRLWNIRVFIPCRIRPFACSTFPFVWGCTVDDTRWLMPKSEQHLANFAHLNWVSLYVRTHLGTPNLYMILCRNLTDVSCVMFTTGIASIHLVNVSIARNKNLNPPVALGRMSTILFPQIANG
jgi:hypothetical protein